MPDYSKCLIYKLCCNDLNIKELYIGSTCNFTRRKNQHKNYCNSEKSKNYNCKVYKFIRDNGGWNNWTMILVEEFSCENKMQKLKRERYWLEELKASLNGTIPGRDEKEYYQIHKDKIRFTAYNYKQENKEKILLKNKEYREIHKEEIKQKSKEYRKTHKEKINEERKETMTCECGSVVRKDGMRNHKKSKKHLDFINKN